MKRIIFALITFILLIFIVGFYYFMPLWQFWRKFTDQSIFSYSKQFFVKNYESKPITFLLLGHGDPSHEGANLTDSIFLAKYDPLAQSAKFVSIPRDVWVEGIQDKINSIYAYAVKKNPDSSIAETKKEFANYFKIPIDYVVAIDFSGISKLIDLLGGVEVVVEEAFIDDKFPIMGMENAKCEDGTIDCRYERLIFAKGKQSMNGERALKFMRSRNSSGDAGTDFARQARQFLVIEAIRNKMITSLKNLDFRKWSEIYDLVNLHTKRDLDNDQILQILTTLDFRSSVLIQNMTPDQNFWKWNKDRKFKGIYVLTPSNESDEAFAKYLQCSLLEGKQKSECEKIK